MELNININNSKLNPDTVYDLLIVGGGPAGLNAALYARRKGLNVGIISKNLGGQVVDTSSVENYLGYTLLSGFELVEKFKEHVRTLDVPIGEYMTVEKLVHQDNDPVKKILLSDGSTYQTRSIIIASGSRPRKLGIRGEDQYVGKGVAYCAICDGPFFMDEEIIVAGGGNSAIEAAIDLSKIGSKVTVVHRSQLRADQILIDQIGKIENVEIKLNTEIKEVLGDKLVSGIRVLDKSNDEEYTIPASGIFVEIGYLPNTSAFEDLLSLNERGEILVDKYGETNIKGIFAAGDVTDTPYKQIIMSAADGAKCALSANDYLNRL